MPACIVRHVLNLKVDPLIGSYLIALLLHNLPPDLGAGELVDVALQSVCSAEPPKEI